MGDARDTKAFEAKVSSLIAATRHLNVPQALALRSMTFKDPETRRWATDRQLTVVFNVILTNALERFDPTHLAEIRAAGYEPLLPPPGPIRDESLPVIRALTDQVLASLKQRDAPQDSFETGGSENVNGGDLTEALATRANFETLLTRRLPAAPPKSDRRPSPTREPPPLFNAQTDRGDAAEDGLAVATPVESREFTDFPTLFDDTLCGHARKILTLMRITGDRAGLRPPFMVAPEFMAVYDEVMRRFILPKMRRSRHIQTLSTSYNWADVGGAKLVEIMQSGEVNNPILHHWDAAWAAIRDSAKAAQAPAKGKAAKVKAPAPSPGHANDDAAWKLFREDATRCTYRPPEPDDVVLLRDILRYEPEGIAKCWREWSQLYEQEFSPSGRQEQAREGAFRDGIAKWADLLPEHLGEFLAIKAYFTFPRCNSFFMRRLLTVFGRTESERARNAPFLAEFVGTLGDD
jgi:hypothetical protein